jgi:hypothetical protein
MSRSKERNQRLRARRIERKSLAVLALLGTRIEASSYAMKYTAPWAACIGCGYMTLARSGDTPVCGGCYDWATEAE